MYVIVCDKYDKYTIAAKCRSMILVSRNIKYMRIFGGPLERGRRRQVQQMSFEYVEAYVAVCC